MKNNIIGKKRMIGAALAAFTIVAGMSAVAFAGEPVQPATAVTGAGTQKQADFKAHELTGPVEINENGDFVVRFEGRPGQQNEGATGYTTLKLEAQPGGEVIEDKGLARFEIPEADVINEQKVMLRQEDGAAQYSIDGGKTWNRVVFDDSAASFHGTAE